MTQTWINFKNEFAKAHQDLRLAQGTIQTSGFHSANNTMGNFAFESATTCANLATCTTTDYQTMAKLMATNSNLTQQVLAKYSEIAKLSPKIGQLQSNRSGGPYSPTGTPGGVSQIKNNLRCWSNKN